MKRGAVKPDPYPTKNGYAERMPWTGILKRTDMFAQAYPQ